MQMRREERWKSHTILHQELLKKTKNYQRGGDISPLTPLSQASKTTWGAPQLMSLATGAWPIHVLNNPILIALLVRTTHWHLSDGFHLSSKMFNIKLRNSYDLCSMETKTLTGMANASEIVTLLWACTMKTRVRVTEVNVSFTCWSVVPRGARTFKAIHQINTGPTVETGIGVALVDVDLSTAKWLANY